MRRQQFSPARRRPASASSWFTPAGTAVLVAALLAGSAGAAPRSPVILPQRPRQYVDTTLVAPSGQTIAVPAGGDFQAALNSARPGDVIMLEAGATFTGPFVLPYKTGSGWITVRTSAPDRSLPPPGSRIDPSYGPVLPKIVVGSRVGGAIQTAHAAHHFRFIGIEFTPVPGAFVYSLIDLGAREATPADLPSHIIIDRCYLHGDPRVGGRRGVAMNSVSTAVVDSYLSEFKEVGADNQAIMGWNGAGPFKIVNNYLEAAGVNVFFGGGVPSIPNLVPSDIEVRGNYFTKKLSWRPGDRSYAGIPWAVKNLFELKNAARVLVDGNVFEHNWRGIFQPQDGFAVAFTPRNEAGGSPWSVVQDVTFTHNIIRHSSAGIQILGSDYNYPSQQLRRLLIQNNLFTDIGAYATHYNAGQLFLIVDGGADYVIDYNTAFHIEDPLYAQVHKASQWPATGFVFTNNIVVSNAGVCGDYTGCNVLSTLSTYFPGYVFTHNVLVGGTAATYPPNNFFPPSLAAVGFVNLAGGDYRLGKSSAYRRAGTDGQDIGADLESLTDLLRQPSP